MRLTGSNTCCGGGCCAAAVGTVVHDCHIPAAPAAPVATAIAGLTQRRLSLALAGQACTGCTASESESELQGADQMRACLC
eukprot:251152-Chlamydomonas_euryale.AAC.14